MFDKKKKHIHVMYKVNLFNPSTTHIYTQNYSLQKLNTWCLSTKINREWVKLAKKRDIILYC